MQQAVRHALHTPRFSWPHVSAPREALVEVLLVDAGKFGKTATLVGADVSAHGRHLSDSLDVRQANRSLTFTSGALELSPMIETGPERRRKRLAWLVEKHGADEIAEAAGVSAAYIDQILKARELPAKADGTRSARNLGNSMAKKIELAMEGLGIGWFDRSDDIDSIKSEQPIVSAGKRPPHDVEIRQFDSGGSMGTGLILHDQPGLIQSWRVSAEWLALNVRTVSSPANLCIVTGFGDSMKPMFNPGDPLLVDRGVKGYQGDAIYFFRVGEEGFIKRLQRIPGQGLVAISENKAYDKWTISADMEMEVFGRVLKVWKGEEF